ncbi:MAG: SGNH/GDSL hydrolase family protein [Ruminococcaceae bacterium]|nr:SGNH/GDSL hydrolase family protein [Oscillospiraceae bacterium]
MELKGKVINFLGDSITEGAGVSNHAENRYDNRLKKMYDLAEVYTYGVGGSRLAHQSVPSANPRTDLCFCGRAYNMKKHADIVVVFGGVNDYLSGDAPFGEMNDKTPATFCGAVYFLMNILKEIYANKTVVFMTPAHCNYNGISDKQVSPRPIKKPCAKPLQAYVDVIKARGKELDVPVLDLFENLGLDPNDENIKEKYTVDGLHFNDEGHEYIAKSLGKFLTSL